MGGLRRIENLPSDLLSRVVAVEQVASTADAKAANARQMVLNDRPKLEQALTDATAAKAETVTLAQLAAQLGAAIPAADAVHAEHLARIKALEATVASLSAKTVTVANGTAALPASLLAGASANVAVTLTRPMGSTTFSVGYALEGGQSLLGNLAITGFVITSQSVVTLTVKNNGLAGLLNLSAATAHVVAVRMA